MGMSKTKEEIATKIRQGVQRRVEENQRIRQLRQEQLEELQEKTQSGVSSNPSGYIPYIIISLVFLSFPLSEPRVDWLLVGCFLLLNGLWTLFFRSSSWLNWALMILSNITLVQWSFIIPDIPNIISKLPPRDVAIYVGGNVAVLFFLYFAYVERRTPWAVLAGRRDKRNTKRVPKETTDKMRELEEFARRRDRMNRIDLAASAVIVGNVVVLIALGVIPKEVILGGYRQLILLLP